MRRLRKPTGQSSHKESWEVISRSEIKEIEAVKEEEDEKAEEEPVVAQQIAEDLSVSSPVKSPGKRGRPRKSPESKA